MVRRLVEDRTEAIVGTTSLGGLEECEQVPDALNLIPAEIRHRVKSRGPEKHKKLVFFRRMVSEAASERELGLEVSAEGRPLREIGRQKESKQ